MGWFGSAGLAGFDSASAFKYGRDVTREGVKANGADDQPAFQALIDDAAANRKYPLIIPPDAVITLGAPLTLKSDVAIVGGNAARGYGYSTLAPSGDFPAIQASVACGRLYVGFICISANALAGGNAYAIDLSTIFMADFERIFVTATDAAKTYRGLRFGSGAPDSVRFHGLQITECRGQHLNLQSGTDCAFNDCNFESDSGVASIGSLIEGKNMRAIAFNNCQFERVGSLYVNARDIAFKPMQFTQTQVVFGPRSKNCRADAAGDQAAGVLYDFGVDNQINAGGQNTHNSRAWPILRGSVLDGFVSSTKTSQRSVYGEGREYLFLVDVQAATIAPGNSTITYTAQPSATTLETSPTYNLENIGGGAESTERKDSYAHWSCLAVPGGDTEIAITGSSNVIPVWHAWPNLLNNGVLSDDSSGDPPTGWTKTGTFTGSYSGGWFNMTSAGSNVAISQTLPITAGEHLFIARVRGDCAISVGQVWNGTDGARQALTNPPAAGLTDVFGTDDHLLMCRFKGQSSLTISIGKLGTPASTIGIRWAAVVRVDQEPKLYALGPPTWTSRYWPLGTVIWNAAPSASNPACWVCVAAGSPGTWKASNLAA